MRLRRLAVSSAGRMAQSMNSQGGPARLRLFQPQNFPPAMRRATVFTFYFAHFWKCRWIFTRSGQLQCAGVGRGCSCGSGSFPAGLCDAALKINAAALQRCGMLLIFFADEIIIIKEYGG